MFVTTKIIAALLVLLVTACAGIPKEVKEARWVEVPQHKILHKWSQNIGQPGNVGSFNIKPLVQDNQVYALGYKGSLQAINYENGDAIWQQELGNARDYSGLDVGQGIIVAGATDGTLLAIQQLDGQPLWDAQLSSSILSAPVIVDKQIVVQLDNEQLVTLGMQNASILWRYYSGNTPFLTLRGTAKPYVSAQHVYTGFANGDFIVLNLNTGNVKWQKNLIAQDYSVSSARISDIDGAFYVTDNLVLANTHNGNLTALNKENGQVIWNAVIDSKYAPVVSAGKLYVVNEENIIYCLDKLTGEIVWTQAALHNYQVSSLVAIFQYLALADQEGNLYLLSQADGAFVGSINLGESITGNSLIVHKDTILLVDDAADLHSVQVR